MSQILPVHVDHLVRSVESARIEFKSGWDEHTSGKQAMRTLCAFANDYQNLHGGYIIFGVAEESGRPVLPPAGLTPAEVEAAQRWLRGRCRAMRPPLEPILAPEVLRDRHVLVVWIPTSQSRPHRWPNDQGQWRHWMRVGESTVDAEKSGRIDLLLEQTARVPWDDRPALDARIEDLRETKVREHLRDVQSGLMELPDAVDIYRRLRITERVNDHEVPRNVGLLFFSEDPRRWFRSARIEVVRFAADRAGKVQDERSFQGPLADQVRGCLRYFEGLSHAHLQKHHDRSQVRGWVSYPQIAFREALVNAVYHRAYRADVVEPTKVFLYPNRVEVISYPGPVGGVELHHLQADGQIPPIPARNRRIGELLKELDLAEGRFTGLPQIYDAMRRNGSPAPSFDFDAGRSYFRVCLPAHPEYAAISAVQDAACLRAVGSPDDARARIQEAWETNASSAALAAEMIRLHAERGEVDQAESVWARFLDEGPEFAHAHVTNTLMEALLEIGEEAVARRALATLAEVPSQANAIDTAILARRLNEQRAAHGYFERAGDAVANDVRALHEFAQTKINLARDAYLKRSPSSREVNRRLLLEARDQLERVVLMDASPTRHAWAWRDLARVRDWLRSPRDDVATAFERACELLPDETRFVRELERFRARDGKRTSRRGNHRGRRQRD